MKDKFTTTTLKLESFSLELIEIFIVGIIIIDVESKACFFFFFLFKTSQRFTTFFCVFWKTTSLALHAVLYVDCKISINCKKVFKKISKQFLYRQNFSFDLKEIIRNCNYLRFFYNLICNNGGLAEWFWNSNVRLDVMPLCIIF